MFKTGHALPLNFVRILRPRSSRGVSTDRPRDGCGSGPQTRQIHDLDSVESRARTHTIHVHELFMSAFSPRQQSGPRTIPVRAQATTSIIREPAAAADAHCPQTGRRCGLSPTANLSRTQSLREFGPAISSPPRRRTVSFMPPIHLPIRIQINPSHDLV